MAASVFCCLRCCRDGGTGHIPLKEMPAVQLDTQHMGKGPPFSRPNGPRRVGRGGSGAVRGPRDHTPTRGPASPGAALRSLLSVAALDPISSRGGLHLGPVLCSRLRSPVCPCHREVLVRTHPFSRESRSCRLPRLVSCSQVRGAPLVLLLLSYY